MTILFFHCYETTLGVSFVWQREESLGRCTKKIDSMALSDLGTVTYWSIDQMFDIDSS